MFKPDYMIGRVSEIDVAFLMRAGVRALILDIDNTLAVPDKRDIPEDIAAWIVRMKESRIPMVLLSNNTARRIQDFALQVDLPFVAKGGKPGVGGYRRAAQMLGQPLYRCAAVGDQLFTDVWGGNRAKMVTILTEPFAEDQTAFIKLKRIAEKPFLNQYRKQGRRG